MYKPNRICICINIECPDHFNPLRDHGHISGCWIAIPCLSNDWEQWIKGQWKDDQASGCGKMELKYFNTEGDENYGVSK